MPKKAYSQAEVNEQKNRIMDEASNVLAVVGVSNLSMRKLAATIGMTAANIYNYFPNKDDLFFQTTQRGFALLQEYTSRAQVGVTLPRDRLVALLKSAVQFSREWSGYWELMFHPPINLRGIEGTSYEEIDKSLRQIAVETMMSTFSEIIDQHALSDVSQSVDDQLGHNTLMVRVITVLTNTHGLIDLYNHRILEQFDVNADAMVDALIESSIDVLFPKK